MEQNKIPKPRIKKVGTHEVTVTLVEKMLSSKGSPMLAIVMENDKGESLRHFIVAQGEYWEKNLFKFKNALGLTLNDQLVFNAEKQCEALVGKKVTVVTKWSDLTDKDGIPYLNVKKFLPADYAKQEAEADNINW